MGEGNGDPNCSIHYVTKDIPPLKLGQLAEVISVKQRKVSGE